MESFFSRFKNSLVLIAIVLVQVIALAVQVQRPTQGLSTGEAPDGRKVTLMRRWITAIVTPFEKVSHGTSLRVRAVWSDYIDLRHTREQNQALKGDVARLREEQAAFAEDAAQGRRLQSLLAFREQYVTSTVAAQVIGTSGSDRSRMLTLDKGSLDGLKPEQPVITPDGLVGKLRDVFPHSAQVLLINDTTSGAGVILASTRIRGILRGTVDGRLQINNLTADSRIKPGEQVVTSGGDMVFPRGVPVGVIESIAPDPQHQPYTAITIKPMVSLARLEEVLVITGTGSTLPVMAQQDASAAEGTAALNAEANKRAADLIAERLPTLHEDTPATQTGDQPAPVVDENTLGGVAGVPNSGLPKAKPVVHPDKYSPGATPPADALRPGAAAGSTPPQTAEPMSAEGGVAMAEHSYTSRRELDQYGFHPAVTLLAPLVCLLLQAILPKTFPFLISLDLPLIATIFFAVSRRSPIAGTVTGTLIGLFQDGLSNNHFGEQGIAKAIVGYIAASIGFAVDVENVVNRVLLVFSLSLLQSGLLYVIAHWLLGDATYRLAPLHELVRAVANCVVAIPLFYLLDRFRTRE